MSEELKEALGRIIESGYQISADGFDYLKTLEVGDLQEGVKNALKAARASSHEVLFLDREFLQKVCEDIQEKPDPLRFASRKPRIRPLAAEHEAEIRLLDNVPAEASGDMDGFVEYFRSRFKKTERILRQRMDVRDAVTIGDALKMPLKSKIKVIGIVTNKRASGSRLFLDIEDSEDSVTVMASDGETVRKGLSILMDQVLCIDGIKYRQDLLIANDFCLLYTSPSPRDRS